jgi:hypothetical protein
MNRFDQHREFPAACLYAVGLSAYVSRTLLLSLSTVADAKISKRPWVNFQSAGWVSFQSAPTSCCFISLAHRKFPNVWALGDVIDTTKKPWRPHANKLLS